MPVASINVRVSDAARLRQLDALAEATGRSRNHIVNEALTRYIEEESWQLAKIEEGLRQADADEFSTNEEVTASVGAVIAEARQRIARPKRQSDTA